ncbi:unnamed protein product [Microthlaspi erraticum]|uniref:Jacalin-type lectin domain-containing protein n=1 Tax=Microthlaspi erraticum TaxID=1685480 RepID=A0A6D2JJR4_9BRAS|nr:unnamed protein product [Microthlaspi erraticum]
MSQDSNPLEMTQRLEAVGVTNADKKYEWDDGLDHDDVTKIYVGGGSNGIQFIKFEYVKTGKVKRSFHGYSVAGFTQMFEIDHKKNEHLESVEGYLDSYGIQALRFKTNLRISEMIGYETGEKFTRAVDGKKIIGFHGSAKIHLESLGAYFTEILPTRLEPKGGKGGIEWDDGADYVGVTKIRARASGKGIHNISFDYINKDGHIFKGPDHGSDTGYRLEPFEINHLDKEYLLSVDGWYCETSGVIGTLQFKTNMKTSKLMGNEETGTKFSLGCNGMKIIGFHGYAKENLNSLGASFTTLPLTKLEHVGIAKRPHWDDGAFQGVRKVSFCYDHLIRCISFEYDNDGNVEARQHGSNVESNAQEAEFEVDYPNEYVTSIEGKLHKYNNYDTLIATLTIKTSTGRSSKILGNAVGDNLVDFVLESKGCALVGFYGSGQFSNQYSLGAYSRPMPSLLNAEKLEAEGGDEEASSNNGGVDGG